METIIEAKECPEQYSIHYINAGAGPYTIKEMREVVAGPNFATYSTDSVNGNRGWVHYKGVSYACIIFEGPVKCSTASPVALMKEDLFSCSKTVRPSEALKFRQVADELISGVMARCYEWTTDSGDYQLDHQLCLHPDYAIVLRRNNLKAETFSTSPVPEDFFESKVLPGVSHTGAGKGGG